MLKSALADRVHVTYVNPACGHCSSSFIILCGSHLSAALYLKDTKITFEPLDFERVKPGYAKKHVAEI